MALRIMYFDLETRKHASELHKDRNIGWDLLRRGQGGISALAIYDSIDDWVYLYDDTTITAAASHLEQADVVVGFSSKEFDLPVIEHIHGQALHLKEHIDLYELIQDAVTKARLLTRPGEYKLGAICKRTIGRGKIEDGGDAPTLARKGQWARLFNYCIDDVRLTRDLYKHIKVHSEIIGPAFTKIPVVLPLYLHYDEE